MKKEILEYKNILKKCFKKDTAHSSCQDNYENLDSSAGHCAVTAILVQEKFSGTIHKINLGDNTHYFNIIDNEIVDLTKEQFEKPIDYSNSKEKTKEDLLKNEDTNKRYLLLKERVNLALIDEEISKCNLCKDLVEHFPSSKTISIGKTKDIIILGEAPANNGWRKSGIAWYDQNKKLLPSGVVMQKLLDIINIKLEDTYFLEAIKCFPKERKSLNTCSKNCKQYLMRQLEEIKPKVVLSLGDAATKTILDIKYKKFNEVVGKEFIVNDIKVIPIYHPSPISPLSFKGNVPIFENLKKTI